ncbi:MAG: molybdopterin molybdenumtransferase MoeA [Alphaproteobacteria bacterium]|nr:molybdopterin molybdenumtransferase MoeA [Alphaproteobacteria bacterium]
MIPVEDALARITGALRTMPAEQVPLADSFGRVLAVDVASRRTQPPLAVSAMDGYAVRAEDVAKIPVTLRLIGTVPAGQAYDGTVGAGEAVRIFTGAPVPHGADAIVIQENTEAADGAVKVVDGMAPKGRYVRAAGLDFHAGDVLLRAGRVLTARDIGLAAGMNVPWLMVRRRPRVALLATGDEIVMPGDPLGANQIVSSNALALACMIRACGGEAIDLGIAPDSADALKAMAEGARGADMLVTTGGASVGDHDLIRQVLGNIGLEVDFWKIAMRPGKPLIFGHIGDTPLLGLPGNPVSALVCGTLFLRPAIMTMLGADAEVNRPLDAVLVEGLPENDERQDYLRATLSRGPGGILQAAAFAKQDSSVFSGMAQADGLVVRAPHAPPAKAGDTVTVIRLGGSLFSI